MSTGFGSAGAATALDAMGAAYRWMKLHIGDPGSAGTLNPAVNTTRKQVTWASTSAGVLSSSADTTWSAGEVTATETYTHFTMWTASTSGTFGWSGTVTGSATAGMAFTLASGDIDNPVTLAS